MSLPVVPLPHGLLDLTLSRTYGALRTSSLWAATASSKPLKMAVHARRMHQAALAATPIEPHAHVEDTGVTATGRGRRHRALGGLSVRRNLAGIEAGRELEKRIQALEVAVKEEQSSVLPPYYGEEDLAFLYEDLLSIPQKLADPSPGLVENEALLQQQDVIALFEAEARLLQAQPDLDLPALGHAQQEGHAQLQTHQKVLLAAQAMIAQIEETRNLAMSGSDAEGRPVAGPSQISVPITVLSLKEYEALIRTCAKIQDGIGARLTLELMKRSRMPISETMVTDALEILATTGNVKDTEFVIANFAPSPNDRQRHLHVKVHLKCTPHGDIPTTALDVLHSYEEKASPAPMETYTATIQHLFWEPTALSRAQGWDLYSHMRYVAHPQPDAWLYSVMIQACANPCSSVFTSEPEKALDLWTEMTVDKKIQPTRSAYNHIILACAKSGDPKFINEAYRLTKQMLEAHRDARGVSAFRPNRMTFHALLQGAKRTGDLTRARWILAEMVRGGGTGLEAEGDEDIRINATTMVHIFHTYAAHTPPFRREATVVVQDSLAAKTDVNSSDSSPLTSNESAQAQTSDTNLSLTSENTPTFSHIPPQTSAELLSEATFLFQRILHDTGALPIPPEHQQRHEEGPHFSPHLVGKFSSVVIDSRLINAYVSIFFQHASLSLGRKMFWQIHEQLGIPISHQSYIKALEKCSYTDKSERELALTFSDELWAKWTESKDSKNDARLIEKAYTARIHLLAKVDRIDRALHVLNTFVHHYPPASIRTPPEKPGFRSTRTSLFGARPLVRMTTTSEIPDDAVPPLLTFRELEVLHQRLVEFGMKKEIAYVGWVVKSYEWMLRVRRQEAFKLKPVNQPVYDPSPRIEATAEE